MADRMELGYSPSQLHGTTSTTTEHSPSRWTTDYHGFQKSQLPAGSPVEEYGGFSYVHGLAEKPSFEQLNPRSTRPTPVLRPLDMPAWPSMLTSQSTFTPPIPAPVSAVSSAPISASAPASASGPSSTPVSLHSSHSTGTSRKTLTDADRRRMCLYHIDHPNVKQTEIGALFGVERSTVSKVLRQKEKYLYMTGSKSPIRKPKGRFPDLERALSNWARKTQDSGVTLTDRMIREKAWVFSTSVGKSENNVNIHSDVWLEEFKELNGLMGRKKPSSKSSGSQSSRDGRHRVHSTTSLPTLNGISPTSPPAVASPSPLSTVATHDSVNMEADNYLDYGRSLRLVNSQSNTSLSSVFTDADRSPFSGAPASPTSPFYSPESNCGPGQFLPQHRLGSLDGTSYSRPRSQTFPTLEVGEVGVDPSCISPPTSSEPLTPKYAHHVTACPTALDSPMTEMPSALGITTTAGPTDERAEEDSSPPTQDEACQALDVVMAFCRGRYPNLIEGHEFAMLSNLVGKLRVHGQSNLSGGLSRIPEHDMDVKLEE